MGRRVSREEPEQEEPKRMSIQERLAQIERERMMLIAAQMEEEAKEALRAEAERLKAQEQARLRKQAEEALQAKKRQEEDELMVRREQAERRRARLAREAAEEEKAEAERRADAKKKAEAAQRDKAARGEADGAHQPGGSRESGTSQGSRQRRRSGSGPKGPVRQEELAGSGDRRPGERPRYGSSTGPRGYLGKSSASRQDKGGAGRPAGPVARRRPHSGRPQDIGRNAIIRFPDKKSQKLLYEMLATLGLLVNAPEGSPMRDEDHFAFVPRRTRFGDTAKGSWKEDEARFKKRVAEKKKEKEKEKEKEKDKEKEKSRSARDQKSAK